MFLEKYARKLGRSFAPLSERALARLRAYAWPGNVRELENVIERGAIVSKSRVFDIDAALPEAAAHEAPRSRPTTLPADRVLSMRELERLERDNIERALRECGGRVSGPNGAAARLGINASTLSSKLRVLGIKRR